MAAVKNMIRAQLVMVAAALWIIKGIAAETLTVGGDAGWEQPTSSSFYADWAAKNTFTVGDVLVFQWTGSHTVAEVTKDAYDNCQISNPIALHQTSPVSITLTTTGDKYYICTISNHCDSGQKLSINVVGSSSSSPSPDAAPSPDGTPASGTDTDTGTGSGSGSSGSSGATSLNLGVLVSFVFLVLGLLC